MKYNIKYNKHFKVFKLIEKTTIIHNFFNITFKIGSEYFFFILT